MSLRCNCLFRSVVLLMIGSVGSESNNYLHSADALVILGYPNVVMCSCSSQVVVCHHIESMQCWHISYGGVGVFTCRKMSFDALSERHSVVQRSRRRLSECSRGWLSFQRLRRKDVVLWRPWLCSFAGTLDQVRLQVRHGVLHGFLDAVLFPCIWTWRYGVFGTLSVGVLWTFLVTTKCQCLFGRCSRPSYFSFCNGLVCPYAMMLCYVLF